MSGHLKYRDKKYNCLHAGHMLFRKNFVSTMFELPGTVKPARQSVNVSKNFVPFVSGPFQGSQVSWSRWCLRVTATAGRAEQGRPRWAKLDGAEKVGMSRVQGGLSSLGGGNWKDQDRVWGGEGAKKLRSDQGHTREG